MEAEGDLSIKQGENISLDCWYYIPPRHEQYILNHPGLDDTTVLAVFRGSKWIKDIPVTDKLGSIVNGKRLSFGLNPDLPKGKYILRLAIKAGPYYPTHNSEKLKLTVK